MVRLTSIFKFVAAIVFVCSKGSLAISCQNVLNENESREMHRNLSTKGEHRGFTITDDEKKKLGEKQNSLPKKMAGIGGIIKFNYFTWPTNSTHVQCCYQYASQRRSIIRGKRPSKNDDQCPANRTCFCIMNKDITDADYTALGMEKGKQYTYKELVETIYPVAAKKDPINANNAWMKMVYTSVHKGGPR